MDLNFFKQTKILDGGMGQELLARGMEPNGTLWSANALLQEKYHKLLLNTHIDFIKAGAEVIVTTTFTTRKIRLKDKPYECGDASPRINIISKTIEEFVVAAEKLSYSMFFESFKDVVPSLDLMSIHVSNIPGKDKDTLLEFILPLEYEKHSSQILDILENKIFELDAMHRFGLVQFKLKFQDRDILSKKKTKKLIDLRE